jgi:hypothetical protein
MTHTAEPAWGRAVADGIALEGPATHDITNTNEHHGRNGGYRREAQ